MITNAAIEAFRQIETPFYYYDMTLLRRTLAACVEQAQRFGFQVHYAIKANDDARIVEEVRRAGLGIDCVSGGEVSLALKAGFDSGKIVFAGVGKTDKEINLALEAGIGCFNVESIPELEVIDAIAGALGTRARIAVRVNPDIDAHTHKYITTGLEDDKFGISTRALPQLFAALRAARNIDFTGVHLHVGSQITDMKVFELECSRAIEIQKTFTDNGFAVANLNLGGGLGVDYYQPDINPVPQFDAWFETIAEHLPAAAGQTFHFEPGRALVAQCGSVITRVVFVKRGLNRTFAIVDAGMNDLIRPALYQAYHKVENLTGSGPERTYDVVGPICESSDIWGEQIVLPEACRGDLFAIRTAGAYGQVMAMPYNRRPFAKAYYSDEILK